MATFNISSAGGPVFFFREFEEPYGFMSQWYPSAFTAPASPSASKKASPMTFLTTEQYMMYQKAIVFHDQEIADQVMLESGPRKQKALGRKVKGFDPNKWDKEKEQIVEEGNWWKFTQAREGNMKEMLLQTGKRELVEASPFDNIWGVGYGIANAEANREYWGENLLGKALMRVRERLQAEEERSRIKIKDKEEGKA